MPLSFLKTFSDFLLPVGSSSNLLGFKWTNCSFSSQWHAAFRSRCPSRKHVLVRLIISLTYLFKLTFSPLSTCTPQMPHLPSSRPPSSVPCDLLSCPRLCSFPTVQWSPHFQIFINTFCTIIMLLHFFFLKLNSLRVLTLVNYLLIDYFFQNLCFKHLKWAGEYGSKKRQGKHKQRNGQFYL